jgi:hypothetical protein
MTERDMRNIERLPSGRYRVRLEHRGEGVTGVVASYEDALDLRDELKRQIVDGVSGLLSIVLCTDLCENIELIFSK